MNSALKDLKVISENTTTDNSETSSPIDNNRKEAFSENENRYIKETSLIDSKCDKNTLDTNSTTPQQTLNINTLSNSEFVEVMNKILDEIIDFNQLSTKSIFNNESIPRITIKNYLLRIIKYCKINKSTMLMCLVYIDRIPSDFIITMYNIHKILLASLLIACKNNEDKIHTNFYFSRVGGINLFEMNLIEIDFLVLIDYNMFVEADTYKEYDNHFFSYIS